METIYKYESDKHDAALKVERFENGDVLFSLRQVNAETYTYISPEQARVLARALDPNASGHEPLNTLVMPSNTDGAAYDPTADYEGEQTRALDGVQHEPITFSWPLATECLICKNPIGGFVGQRCYEHRDTPGADRILDGLVKLKEHVPVVVTMPSEGGGPPWTVRFDHEADAVHKGVESWNMAGGPFDYLTNIHAAMPAMITPDADGIADMIEFEKAFAVAERERDKP